MINLRFNYPSIEEEAIFFKSFLQSSLDQDVLLKQPDVLNEQDISLLANALQIPDQTLLDTSIIHACNSGNAAIFNLLFALQNDHPLLGVEEFTYSGFKSVATRLGLSLKGIQCDDQGIMPSALEEAIAKGIRYLYLQPTIQNPSCSVMGEERRRIIAYMVQKYKLIVIEDDAYRFLHHDPPPTFLSLIPENTIHIFSLSKPYNSFIKCCFIIQPEDVLPQLAGIISDTGSFATSLSLMFSRFLLKNNMLFRLAHRSFPTGFHYWIKLPQNINSKECTNQLMARKIMVTGAHEYSVNGNNGYIRIALSAEKDLDQLKKALTTIRELLLGGIR